MSSAKQLFINSTDVNNKRKMEQQKEEDKCNSLALEYLRNITSAPTDEMVKLSNKGYYSYFPILKLSECKRKPDYGKIAKENPTINGYDIKYDFYGDISISWDFRK